MVRGDGGGGDGGGGDSGGGDGGVGDGGGSVFRWAVLIFMPREGDGMASRKSPA